MPELPEVQTVVNELLDAGVTGRPIKSVDVYWNRTVSGMSPKQFRHDLVQTHITGLERKGKFIHAVLASGASLFIHLRMTGRLYIAWADTPRGPHDHIVLTFDDSMQLRFHDPRKFGRWVLTDTPGIILKKLGIDPLGKGFRPDGLHSRLTRRHRMLKPLLLDQSFIAGLGNIYVDEALWTAGLHPCRQAASLSMEEVRSLRAAIVRVLKQGIENGGTSLGKGTTNFHSPNHRIGANATQLNVFRRTGLPCPRCGAPIQRTTVCQRGTHICPVCQKI